MDSRISIIILNWNGWEDTIECLESLYRINYSNFNIVVVDNASEDESIEKIRKYANGKIEVKSKFLKYDTENKPILMDEYTKKEVESHNDTIEKSSLNKKLILIKNDKNYGFAEGNNIGIKYSLNALNSDYIFLLNNDTVVKKNFLGELIRAANLEDSIGIVGCKICYYDDSNKIWSSDCKIGWWTGSLPTNDSKIVKETDWVSGCGILIKANLINEISLLDPELFFGWEDIDYCIRAKNANYKVIYNPNSIIWHKVSTSRKKLYENAFSPYYNRVKNRFLFLKILKRYSSKYQQITQFIFFLIVYAPVISLILPIYDLAIGIIHSYSDNKLKD